MVKRWLIYLAALAGCLAFYFVYRQWMAWLLLVGISALPLLSLLLCLPAMLTARFVLHMPDSVTRGDALPLGIRMVSPLPLPTWHLQTLAQHSLTGQLFSLKPGANCPTEHCGALDCTFSRGWVYDYMGLFRLSKRTPPMHRLWIRPQPMQPKRMPDPDKIAVYWRPKPGGGFSENHELRLYRPGDSLRQIHWKLSSKTGKLIYREPMEVTNNRLLLWLIHGGQPEEMDRKLGRLLWLSGFLQQRGVKHDVLAHTADGQLLWHIGSVHTLSDVMDTLLCRKPLQQAAAAAPNDGSQWHLYIGGEAHEAP